MGKVRRLIQRDRARARKGKSFELFCCIDECSLNRDGERCGASWVLIRPKFSGGITCDFFDQEWLGKLCSEQEI